MVSRESERPQARASQSGRNIHEERRWLAAQLDRVGGEVPAAESLQRLLAKARERKLNEDLVPEMTELRGRLAAALMDDAVRSGRLPMVTSLHPLPPGDRCHFIVPVRFGRRRSDQCGHLALTTRWLRFYGALDLGVTWAEVFRVARTGQELSVALHDSDRLLRFHCPTVEDAAGASVLATHLAATAQSAGAAPERVGTPRAFT